MPSTTIDIAALYEALDNKRDLRKISWRELARDLDLSPSTFTRMAQGQRPDIDTFATMLRWLDVPAAGYMRTEVDASAPSHEKDTPLVQVATLLRASKQLKPDQADALNHIIKAAYESIVKD